MLRRTFRAMGTEVELLLDAEVGRESIAAFAAAEAEFHRLEALLSRFRPDSELSRLNEAGGKGVTQIVKAESNYSGSFYRGIESPQ